MGTKNMTVQSYVFCSSICNVQELFFRLTGNAYVNEGRVKLCKDSHISFDTYLNLFDAQYWEKYTGIHRWKMQFCAAGYGKVKLMYFDGKDTHTIAAQTVAAEKEQAYQMAFDTRGDGYFYLEGSALKTLTLCKIEIHPTEIKQERNIQLGVVICTYKRRREIERNLQILRESLFFRQDSSLAGKMSIQVVDNASELLKEDSDYVHVHWNRNTGGSGGFARGMLETRQQEKKYGTTHVVLMDDDVEFLPETFYRLYALLSLMKQEWQTEVIAGRMFRTDRRQVQYTAAEIWNKGDLRHCGYNLDCSKAESLFGINENELCEYSGWWFACFPMDFVRENLPLPFFIHCDDVEYGLRHGGRPIILNGIQVWHETYEYRQSPVMSYYDKRNPRIVNQIYGLGESFDVQVKQWRKQIAQYHVQQDYLMEYMEISAFLHALNGVKWLKRVNGEQLHKRLKHKQGNRLENAVLWRWSLLKAKISKRLQSF